MPISLPELKSAINPKKTTLLFGAGASVPCGAPLGKELAEELWRKVARVEPKSGDLIETTTLLRRNYTRRSVVEAIAAILQPLQPTGGMLVLPNYPWQKIFTTNFDQLVERAYARTKIPLAVYQSNYDFTRQEESSGTKLFKIHGCITKDVSLGDASSLTLTESDYEEHKRYRQSLFAELSTSLMNNDVLIIGQSLKDEHLRELIKDVLKAKKEGALGHVFALIFDPDDVRAPSLEDKGVRIAFGGIDEFLNALGDAHEDIVVHDVVVGLLPPNLAGKTYEVLAEAAKPANILRMFNGGPASYADVAARATFDRHGESGIVAELYSGALQSLSITGAAGVGKTTFARKLLFEMARKGFSAWEHKADFFFDAKEWLSIEASLRDQAHRGVLLIDECTHFMRDVNAVVSTLSAIENCALQVILTSNSAQWERRVKNAAIYSMGRVLELSRLDDVEIASLLNLVEYSSEIKRLVQPEFRNLNREKQFQLLRQKCGADMFVCLKNIFATESLDTILLHEFEELDGELQDLYRYVAALEAVGMRVHRQLILRMLNLVPTQVRLVLQNLSGIVDEYDILPREGIFGWRTRHIVIARRITDYKFSGIEEQTALFERIIDEVNPTVPIELQGVRDICDTEFGIGRLADRATRIRLYEKLISVVPAERIPWHRLIRELIDSGKVDEADHVIRQAEESAGSDAPIDRYKVRLLIARAKQISDLDEDRIALLRRAYELALKNVERRRHDKFSFYVLIDAALEQFKLNGNRYVVDEALKVARKAAEDIQDPDMDRRILSYERMRI